MYMPNFLYYITFTMVLLLFITTLTALIWLAMDHEKSGQDGWKNYLNG